jgi:hypothetical protein
VGGTDAKMELKEGGMESVQSKNNDIRNYMSGGRKLLLRKDKQLEAWMQTWCRLREATKEYSESREGKE